MFAGQPIRISIILLYIHCDIGILSTLCNQMNKITYMQLTHLPTLSVSASNIQHKDKELEHAIQLSRKHTNYLSH